MPRKPRPVHDRPMLPSLEQQIDEAVLKIGFIIGYYFPPMDREKHTPSDADHAIRAVLIKLTGEAGK